MALSFDSERDYPFFAYAKIVEQVVPSERDSRYGHPLSAFLEENRLGMVVGGGCSLGDRAQPGEKDIVYAGLDLKLANLAEAIVEVKRKLVELGIPVRSELQFKTPDGIPHSEPMGELELLNVFIDNVSLEPEIYEEADIDCLIKEFRNTFEAGGICDVRGPCVWPSEVLFYFAGKNADEIFSRLEPLRKSFPILQNARVVFQRIDQSRSPIEIRIGFN